MATTTTNTTKLSVPDIVCGGCANAVKKALGSLSNVSEVEVNVETSTVTVKHDEKVSSLLIVEALDRAGFSAF